MNRNLSFSLLNVLALLLSVCILITLPFLEALYSERLVGLYLQFPPKLLYTEKKAFSAFAFVFVALFSLGMFIGFLQPFRKLQFQLKSAKKFPARGWLALSLLLFFWYVAWNRFTWFSLFQLHSFVLLWLSYLLFANALLEKRTGTSLFVKEPLAYSMSFLLSASFWWVFEYLNRFVQNWYYQAVSNLNEDEYFLLASLAFSTLLPSVWVTKELLASFYSNAAKSEYTYLLSAKASYWLSLLGLLISFATLWFLTSYPSILFPMVWVLPLLLFASYSLLLKYTAKGVTLTSSFFSECSFWAFASLSCGFLWELWNLYSLAKWKYHISYVDTLRIFEMPLLGYSGYLPFGLCCWMPVAFLRFSLTSQDTE